jgi:uncharacterized membrane protein YGL010W
MQIPFPRIVDSALPWALAGFFIGFGLGVNTASMWLVVAGLVLFAVYLWRHGKAQAPTECRLFAGGPAFIVAWIVGFVVHGLAF